jgi:hypothetical protein
MGRFAFSQLLGMAEEEDSSKLILVVDLVIGLMGDKRAFEEVEQRFLQPLVEALWPFAHLFVESQVCILIPFWCQGRLPKLIKGLLSVYGWNEGGILLESVHVYDS